MLGQSPADWYPDPLGRHEVRYWDGSQWTAHVASQGLQGVDPPVEAAPGVISPQIPAGWYADPSGTRGRRYWDGHQWTHHVHPDETKAVDAPANHAQPSPAARPSKKVERQVRKVGAGDGPAGGGTMLTERVLVVNQNAKRFRSPAGYSIYDQCGRQLGSVQQVRRDLLTKSRGGRRGRGEVAVTDEFQVVDLAGRVLLAVARPELGFWSKSPVVVEGPDRAAVGDITREASGLAGSVATLAHAGLEYYLGPRRMWGFNGVGRIARKGIGGAKGFVAASALDASGVSSRLNSPPEKLEKIGHVRFGLEAGGQRLASIHAATSEELEFTIQDLTGTEIGRIRNTRARAKANKYVVQMHRPLEQPLRSLVVAAAVVIDLALER